MCFNVLYCVCNLSLFFVWIFYHSLLWQQYIDISLMVFSFSLFIILLSHFVMMTDNYCCVCNWPPPGGICFCRRLSVCLSVCNITQKVMDQFWWNFQGLIATLRSGSGSFLRGQGQNRSKGQIHLNGYNFWSNCHRDFKLGSYSTLWKVPPNMTLTFDLWPWKVHQRSNFLKLIN